MAEIFRLVKYDNLPEIWHGRWKCFWPAKNPFAGVFDDISAEEVPALEKKTHKITVTTLQTS